MTEQLYDVVQVNLESGEIRLMGEGKTQRNAEAIEKMAIMRRGVEDQFFTLVPACDYKDGDNWRVTSGPAVQEGET